MTRLKEPPIVEVLCGFFFPAIAELDPILVGRYWAEKKRERFPTKQVQPPVTERPGITFAHGVGPLRSWLVSASDEYIVQIQPDRFYFNWRRRQNEYPHFRDDGEQEGVLTKSLREFREFCDFCVENMGVAPTSTRVQVAKIDQIVQGRHFTDLSDLAKLIPALAPIVAATMSGEPMLNMSFQEPREGCEVLFQLANAALGPGGEPSIQLETRVTVDAGPDARETFLSMNIIANHVFFRMLDEGECLARFGGPKT